MPLDCDVHVLSTLSTPAVDASKPVITTGTAEAEGVGLAGANVVIRSTVGIAAWREVIRHPEIQDDWHPPEMGTKRVERLDPSHIYMQSDMSMLFGAVRIRRQAVVGIHWLAQADDHVENCWFVTDAAPYQEAIAAWPYDATFLTVGYGGWDIRPLPDGALSVSYQFWTEAKVLPSQVQAWAMSRTLPNLMRTFDARAASVEAAMKAGTALP